MDSQILAVSPGYFDTAIKGFLHINTFEKDYDILDDLYSSDGSSGALIGRTYQDLLGINYRDPFVFEVPIRREGAVTVHVRMCLTIAKNFLPLSLSLSLWLLRCQVDDSFYSVLHAHAQLDSAPGFTFSKYPGVTHQDLLVSYPSYLRILNRISGCASTFRVPESDALRGRDSLITPEATTVAWTR